jgi:hypothetical protein
MGLTRENTAARNRAALYESRIEEAASPRQRMSAAWGWLAAETVLGGDDLMKRRANQLLRMARLLNRRRQK